MRDRNPLHIAMGVLGLLGVLLYVLSCRPAWSPDSSKVLFTYSNPDTKESGVALYDRNTGAVRPIFSCNSGRDKCSDAFPSAAWSGDGSRAVILWEETRKRKKKNSSTGKKETFQTTVAHVEVLPMGREGKKLHVKLRHFEPSDNNVELPLAVSGTKLYLIGKGKRSLLQLDLRTGEQKFRDLEGNREEPLLYSHNGQVGYSRDSADYTNEGEFGELDTKDLSLHSWFVLKKESLEAQGVSEFIGLIAFEPHGNRMAMPAVGVDKKARILMCGRRGLEEVFKPELPDPASRLGNLEWSRDGKTLYAGISTPTEKKDFSQLSVVEIPLAGGPVRLTPILRVQDASDEGFEISISPDKSTIAVSTAYADKDKIDSADRGLFLVDLHDSERRVTRIQYPPVTGEKKPAGE